MIFFIAAIFGISAIVAFKEQKYFSSTVLIKILVFLMNIIPVAVSARSLLHLFGFKLIYFFIVYLILQQVSESLIQPAIISVLRINNRPKLVVFHFINEIILVFLAIPILNSLPQNYHSVYMEQGLHDKFKYFSYYIYIALFNSVNFFIVEYASAILKEEYKKNYAKYFFKYNNSIIARFFWVIRNTGGLVLLKIKKNITWLVSFIITLETIFNFNYTIGFDIIDNPPSVKFFANVLHIIIIMLLINLIIDVSTVIISKNTIKGRNLIKVEIAKKESLHLYLRKNIFVILGIFIVVYVVLILVNMPNYPIVSYYNFNEHNNKKVSDVFGDTSQPLQMQLENLPSDIIGPYIDKTLWMKEDRSSFVVYRYIEVSFADKDGSIFKLIPFYNSSMNDFFFIRGTVNTQQDRLEADYTLLDIGYSKGIKIPAKLDIMVHFYLPTSTTYGLSGIKPLFLVVPFYIIYFMTILLITFVFTYILFNSLVKSQFSGNNGKAKKIAAFISDNILLFLNTITMIVAFLLINMTLKNYFKINWIRKAFVQNIFLYIFVQIIIIWMFSGGYIHEVRENIKKSLNSEEYKYLDLIGMSKSRQMSIFNKKYGNLFYLRLFIQNILFVININWFILYAFNTWASRNIDDYIGLSFSPSFENIFIKSLLNEASSTPVYNYAILVLLNALLFGIYYYLGYRIRKEKYGA
jgi:hypothetical protein